MQIIGKIGRRARAETDSLFDKMATPLLRLSSVEKFLEKKEKNLHNKVQDKLFANTDDYQDYVKTQIKKSHRHSKHVRFWRGSGRTILISQIEQFLPEDRSAIEWLCVGCMDKRELGFVKSICGVKNVTGLDLYSSDPRIKVGDMHMMPFEDNSFDVLNSIDNFEHAYDPQKVVDEFKRVVKPGGLIAIEVPIDYKICAIDRFDYKSAENIMEMMKLSNDCLIFTEYTGQLKNKRKLRMIVKNGT